MDAVDYIVLGGGCFWCLEAVYQRVKGVEKVTNGYSGGNTKNPSYDSVCSGTTNHAEVVKIEFDTSKISLELLLKIFWSIHNPTTRNRQGNDIGTQYRSVIFFRNKKQKAIAEKSLSEVAQVVWEDPIVTEIAPLTIFYPSETHHQNYFNRNPEAAYCQIVINPKIQKLKQQFTSFLKN